MKKILRLVSFFIVLSVIFSLLSCSGSNTSNTAIILSEKSIEISELGATYKIEAAVSSNTTDLPPLVWSSSDESIATCKDGVVTAIGYGVCVVRASCGDASSACTVNIPNPNPKLTLSDSILTLYALDSVRTVTAISETGADISSKAMWKSSNEKIATCVKGAIKPISYGVCTITAFINNEHQSCIVEIINPDAPSVSIDLEKNGASDSRRAYKTLKLEEGEEFSTSATVTPADSTVKWLSSDESVAVCVDGKIIAKQSGACVIIAVSNRGASDYIHLTVGSYSDPKPNEAKLIFGFPDVGKELRYVDRDTGRVSSISVITSYSLTAEPYEKFPDRMLITLELHCVKVYDIAGVSGVTPAHVTTNMYREGDVFCEERTFKEVSCNVGESFTVKYEPQFTIQESAAGPRSFYMTFAEYTEL